MLSRSSCVFSGKSWCLETQDGIVGRLLELGGRGWVVAETGMWSEVVARGERGSQRVLISGCWSKIVEGNMLVYILSILVRDLMLCLVGLCW